MWTRWATEPCVISGGWYNVLPKGGFTERHRHESSVVSGAFYIKLPQGDCGKLLCCIAVTTIYDVSTFY